jgi:hypothetical protein
MQREYKKAQSLLEEILRLACTYGNLAGDLSCSVLLHKGAALMKLKRKVSV